MAEETTDAGSMEILAGRPVIQLITGRRVFGVEKYALTLSEHLRRRGVKVIPVCSYREDAFSEFAARQFEPVFLPMVNYLDLRAYRALHALVTSSGACIVHSHLGIDSLFAAAVASSTDCRAVHSVHFNEPAYLYRALPLKEFWRLVQIAKNKHISRFLAVSQAAASSLSNREYVPQSKIGVINPGIEPVPLLDRGQREKIRAGLGIKPDQLLALTVARLSPEKDPETLIQAAAIVGKQSRRTQFLIAGEGPLKAPLQQQIDALAIGEFVHLAGYRNDALELIGASDICILSSRQEGFGIAAVEAMMCGRPVVGTAAGGLSEIVVEGETGMLVEPGNSQALARAILHLVDDPQLRARMGEQGLARAHKLYTADHMSELVLSVYQQISRI